MNKLTVNEINARLSELGLDINQYATLEFRDYDYNSTLPEGFADSEYAQSKLKKAKEKHDRAYAALKAHKGYETASYRDDEFDELSKEYSKTYYSDDTVIGLAYINSLGLGRIEQVEQTGGYDEGSNWSVVRYFADHDVYIKIDAYYSSYDGVECNDGWGYEVVPKQVVNTIYKKLVR